MACGMAPEDDAPQRAVLVWEGALGKFYLVDDKWQVVSRSRCSTQPGARYALLFAIADPRFPDDRRLPPPGGRRQADGAGGVR